MFTPAGREAIRGAILERARADARLSGGAVTGSASIGNKDAWSDIDLAFGVRSGTSVEEVLADYAAYMEQEFGSVDWFDVPSGTWIYRVFLLPNTLQIDLAFAPEQDFGARAPTFKLQFGLAASLSPPVGPDARGMIGYAWLYALHARSSLARGRLWQAEYFVCALRNQILALACLRHALPHRDGRGYDRLPLAVLRPLAEGFANSASQASIATAFHAVTQALLTEIRAIDPEKAASLQPILWELTGRPSER